MEIVVSEDFDLTNSIKEAVHERVETILKYLKDNPTVKVFLSKNGANLFKVQLALHSQHHDFAAHSESEDFYVGLNEAKQRIIRQIKDQKGKKLSKRHH